MVCIILAVESICGNFSEKLNGKILFPNKKSTKKSMMKVVSFARKGTLLS